MAANLFGNAPQNKVLVEFRAGKMTLSGNVVTPDKRKGLVQLIQTPDGLVNFVWRDRTTNAVEDEWFIFPEEASVKKIKQSSGRVFLLEWKLTGRKLFYWMQETAEDKDDEFLSKINQYINNPPVYEVPSTGQGPLDPNALMSMFQPPPQQQAPQQTPPATRPPQPAPSQTSQPTQPAQPAQPTQPTQPAQPATPAPQQPRPAVQPQDLQNFFASMGLPASSVNQFLQTQQPQPKGPSLQQVLDPQVITPLLDNPAVQAQLLPLLPEGRRTPEELRSLFTSPQVQQSLETFNAALQSGELTDLLRQFGIQAPPGPTSVVQFLSALEKSQNQQNQKPSDKKDDDKMDI